MMQAANTGTVTLRRKLMMVISEWWMIGVGQLRVRGHEPNGRIIAREGEGYAILTDLGAALLQAVRERAPIHPSR